MAPPDGGSDPSGGMGMLLMFGAMFLIMYFLIIRPQQKRQKETQNMVESLKKDDKVITASGIHGKVVTTDEKTISLRVSENSIVVFEKSAIASKK